MVNKSLDGIKKLSGEELEKARRIVLDSIGEKDKRVKKEEKSTPVFFLKRKMIDGISSGGRKVGPSELKPIPQKEKTEGREIYEKKLWQKPLPPERRKPLAAPLQTSAKTTTFKRTLASGIAQVEKAARQEAKLREKEVERKRKMRVKEDEERRKETEKKEEGERKAKERVEREKERIRLKKEEDKKRKERKEERKIARKIWWGRKKAGWQKFRARFGGGLKGMGKVFAFSLSFLVILIILFYLVFALLLLKFNLDNKVSRQIATYVPVPAVITKIGWINYYEYLKIIDELKEKYSGQEEEKEAIKQKFIEEVIFTNLAKKYKIDLGSKNREEAEEEININLAVNKEINSVPYSRIEKIKQLVTSSQSSSSFEEIGKKYGDEIGYVSQDNEYLQLKEEVRQLEPNQISNIIITDRGYYIVKKDGERLKYIFVKSINFDKFLEEMLSGLKIWVLAG